MYKRSLVRVHDMKGRIFLVHWSASEAKELSAELRSQGWNVEVESEDGGRGYRLVKSNPPDVVVIYLTRLPSMERETGHSLREIGATRDFPIVLVGRKEAAVEKTRAKVRDAVFTTSEELGDVLAQSSQSDDRA